MYDRNEIKEIIDEIVFLKNMHYLINRDMMKKQKL